MAGVVRNWRNDLIAAHPRLLGGLRRATPSAAKAGESGPASTSRHHRSTRLNVPDMFYYWNDGPTRELAHADPKADGKACRFRRQGAP